MPNPAGELWIVAGCTVPAIYFHRACHLPNGPLEGVPTPNLDRNTGELLRLAGYADPLTVTKEVYWEHFAQADAALQEEIRQHLTAGKIVCVETVLSTDKYLPLVALAKELGASFRFVYVTLRTPELAKARVAQRALAGGHPVPEAAVVKRFHRSLDNLPKFAKLADEFWVYDNSDSAYNPDTTSTAAPVLAVHGSGGKVTDMDANCPVDMARRFLPMPR